ncbi:pyridoxamine 5'-phosphate oxidase family protein [Microbacteriaceae bacterium]|nr:pyridoxamine 5'-phosphate oxidase family protein [Candidatus Saccharibacteria bacterium]
MVVDVRQFLHDAHHMVVSVIDENGHPWGVPVGIRSYEAGRFEWISMIDAVHSQAIEKDSRVSVTVFNTPDDARENFGFYAKASAKKIGDLAEGAAIYEALCTEAWYNDHTHKKTKIDIKEL